MNPNHDNETEPEDNCLTPYAGGFPFIDNILDRMMTNFDSAFSGIRPKGKHFWGACFNEPARAPRVDLVDKGDHFILYADAPGFDKDTLSAEVYSDRIVLKGQTREEKHEEDSQFIHRERVQREFTRVIPLPENVLSDKAEAQMNKGVLEITLPKKNPEPREAPKKLKIA